MWFTIKTNPLLLIHKREKNKNCNKNYQNYIYQFQYKRNVPVKPLKVVHWTPGFHRTRFEYHCPVMTHFFICSNVKSCYSCGYVFLMIQLITLSVHIILQTKCNFSFITFHVYELVNIPVTHNLNQSAVHNLHCNLRNYVSVDQWPHLATLKNTQFYSCIYMISYNYYIQRSNKQSDNQHH